MTRIIDPVVVYEDSPDKSTDLDQRVPVAAVASQPGSLDREHGAAPPLTNRRQQALEARPTDATSRAAEVIVDDLDRGPAELPGAIGEPVLTAAALRIVQQLIARRLANIDESTAAQVLSRDLGHRPSPRPPTPPRSRAAGLLPALPSALSVRGSARHATRPGRTDPAECWRSCASLAAFSMLEAGWGEGRKPTTP